MATPGPIFCLAKISTRRPALAMKASWFMNSTSRFGFAGPEIFPIENQISQLRVTDLDGDGLNDIIVVNNARSRINLLYNQTGKTNLAQKPKPEGKRDLNELPPDARFRVESIASEKRIFSLADADLNSDGRADLAYYGDPRELIVLYNQGTNGWSAPKRWPIEDGQQKPSLVSIPSPPASATGSTGVIGHHQLTAATGDAIVATRFRCEPSVTVSEAV